MAERVRFELTTQVTPGNGFRDRRIRPLCHLSYPKLTIKYQITIQIITEKERCCVDSLNFFRESTHLHATQITSCVVSLNLLQEKRPTSTLF